MVRELDRERREHHKSTLPTHPMREHATRTNTSSYITHTEKKRQGGRLKEKERPTEREAKHATTLTHTQRETRTHTERLREGNTHVTPTYT